jgi:hypothetical protein
MGIAMIVRDETGTRKQTGTIHGLGIIKSTSIVLRERGHFMSI